MVPSYKLHSYELLVLIKKNVFTKKYLLKNKWMVLFDKWNSWKNAFFSTKILKSLVSQYHIWLSMSEPAWSANGLILLPYTHRPLSPQNKPLKNPPILELNDLEALWKTIHKFNQKNKKSIIALSGYEYYYLVSRFFSTFSNKW